MEIKEYVEKKQKIQNGLLKIINDSDDNEENFDNFFKIITDQKICENRYELKATLSLLVKISNNHYRLPTFFQKIEKILFYFKNSIEQHLTNTEIFHIFSSNKRILLFIIEEKMLSIDDTIIDFMEKDNNQTCFYIEYFYPEIKDFLNEEFKNDIENEVEELKNQNMNKYNEKRKNGENDQYICQLIRKDLIDEFISFVNQKSIHLESQIEQSIYETNPIIYKNDTTLIEYSAFYGSVQIFKYLYLNGNPLSYSLWPFIVHGQHPEIIQIFIDNYMKIDDDYPIDCIIDSLKFHHNDITKYIIDNFSEKIDLNNENFFIQSVQFYNYEYFSNNIDNERYFYFLCKYDHFTLVDILLKTMDLNINEIIISIDFFFPYEIDVSIQFSIQLQSNILMRMVLILIIFCLIQF